MTDKNEVIALLEEALKQSGVARGMIVTAEIQRTDPEFIFGVLVNARQSVDAAKANIERAITLLKG